MNTKNQAKDQKKAQTPFTQAVLLWLKRHPYWSSFFVGCIYFGVVVSWMFTLKTAEIARGEMVKIVATSAGLIISGSFALGFVVFTWLYRRFRIRLLDTRALLLVPAAWLVSEYARAILFSITSLGPGGRIGPYWTFGNLGYYLAETPLAFLARFGGLYMLSGVMVLLFVAGYQSYSKRSFLPLTPILMILCVFSWLGYKSYLITKGPTRTIVAARYPSKDIQARLTRQPRQLLEKLPQNSVDAIVLPEYSEYFGEEREQDITIAKRVLKSDDGLIIHSADEATKDLGHNVLTFQNANGGYLNQQQKWFIVPAGEFVPYIYQVVLAYAGQTELLRDFNNQKSIDSGEHIERPYTFNAVSYGSLACSGVVAPDFYNGLARAGADIFTNSASLDTMGISPLFHLESQNMNKLTAIAHAKPFVQSARGGPAYIIDSNGHLVKKDDSKNGGIVVATVKVNDTKTIYTILGDWVVYLSIIGLTGYGVILLRRKTTTKSS